MKETEIVRGIEIRTIKSNKLLYSEKDGKVLLDIRGSKNDRNNK